ncbi:MAG TPA: hypothetical protein VME86_00805 [Acidobacteriaceae bacterium]|nr:hypothetical protein [Acidobacteriaceae bacterium]
MDEFRRAYDQAGQHYEVVLWPGIECIELEVELPSGEKIPCRYEYASKTLKSRLTEQEVSYFTPPNWIMVDRVPVTLSPEVVDVAQAAIAEFFRCTVSMSH